MSNADRIVIAICVGLISAGLGTAFSFAARTAHVLPGAAVAFGMATIITLRFLRRWQS